MKELTEYSLGDNGSVLVEVEGAEESGFAPASRAGAIVTQAVKSLDEALDQVKAVGALIIAKLTSIAHAPQETSIELGFKLSAGGKAILVSTNAEGHVKLTMTWKHRDQGQNAGSIE